jgi:hypothetical protein
MATEVGNLFNLRHPLIAPLIEFVFPVESDGLREVNKRDSARRAVLSRTFFSILPRRERRLGRRKRLWGLPTGSDCCLGR